MMKNLLFIILTIVFVCGCNSAKKAYVKGHYDTAIKKSIKKLRKDASDAEHLQILSQAYKEGNASDLTRISFLDKETSDENSAELYNLYLGLKRRQDLIKTSPAMPNGIEFVDYDEKLIEAKNKAASYHYQNGLKLLASESHFDAREAHRQFIKVKNYYADYEDVDLKIAEAKDKGITYVLVETVNNDAYVSLPPEFLRNTQSSLLENQNMEWVRYAYNTSDNDYYIIRANITSIVVSPERIKESNFRESKEVKDGWEYQKDANGKVVEDSLGTKIKVDVYKTIFCNVRQELRTKRSVLTGFIEYHVIDELQPIKSIPFNVAGVFSQIVSYPSGNTHALSPETKQTVGVNVAPFPFAEDLILIAADELEMVTLSVIRENQNIIK
jgi:hypothetical protein